MITREPGSFSLVVTVSLNYDFQVLHARMHQGVERKEHRKSNMTEFYGPCTEMVQLPSTHMPLGRLSHLDTHPLATVTGKV